MINQAFEMKFKMSKISPPNVKNKTATYWYSPTYKYEFSSWVKAKYEIKFKQNILNFL